VSREDILNAIAVLSDHVQDLDAICRLMRPDRGSAFSLLSEARSETVVAIGSLTERLQTQYREADGLSDAQCDPSEFLAGRAAQVVVRVGRPGRQSDTEGRKQRFVSSRKAGGKQAKNKTHSEGGILT